MCFSRRIEEHVCQTHFKNALN
uniref:Uncharacterized protein n=1 Tax=Anguilla anguilla TaxID=7936 RepID=A0A0E9U432_ANGAN